MKPKPSPFKKKLLVLALAALLLGGASGCITVNVKPIAKQEAITEMHAIHKAYRAETYNPMEIVVPTAIFETNRAIIPIQWIDGMGFREVMRQVYEKGIKNVHLDISSGGGGLFEMFTICDELDRFKRNGGWVTSHISGIAGSAAVPIFLMGDERTMDKSAWMMMHPHSLWDKKPYDFGMWTSEDSDPTTKTLFVQFALQATSWYAWTVAENTNITFEQAWYYITTLDANRGMFWFNSEEALMMGFPHKLI